MGNTSPTPQYGAGSACLTRRAECEVDSECVGSRARARQSAPSETPKLAPKTPPKAVTPPRSPRFGSPRFTLPLEAEKLHPYDLIVDFISSAKKDGYIADEDCKVLLGAVDHISNEASSPRESGVRESSSQKETQAVSSSSKEAPRDSSKEKPKACKIAHAHGYADLKAVEGHVAFWSSKGEKIRGTFEDQSFADPKVAKLLQSGVDCEAILHDRAFNCRTRGFIQEDACIIVHGFMQPVNYLGYYRMPGEKLNTWLNLIGEQYSQDVQYHNWLHALDVFQLSFLVLTDGGMTDYFNTQDCCAIMIAAVAHDVGHEGKNNSFQLKAQTELATIYNDKSPLENMHASLTFETLRKPEANFLELLPVEDFENVRAKIIDTILATDPTHHFPFVGKLAARLKQGPILTVSEVKAKLDNDLKAANKVDRTLLLQGFVHMWDVGNGFRPWDTYKLSVSSLEEEFFIQGDAEAELGLPITTLMNRSKDRLAAGQDFFLGKLVLPLFDLYANFMKQDLVNLLRSTLESNKARWHDLIKKHGLHPAGEILALEALHPTEVVENLAVEVTPRLPQPDEVVENPAPKAEVVEDPAPKALQPTEVVENFALKAAQPSENAENPAPEAALPVESAENLTPEAAQPVENAESLTPEAAQPSEDAEDPAPETSQPTENVEKVAPEAAQPRETV